MRVSWKHQINNLNYFGNSNPQSIESDNDYEWDFVIRLCGPRMVRDGGGLSFA